MKFMPQRFMGHYVYLAKINSYVNCIREEKEDLYEMNCMNFGLCFSMKAVTFTSINLEYFLFISGIMIYKLYYLNTDKF